MENKKEKIIELINKFENKCLDCGKQFLAIGINSGSHSNRYHPEIYKYDFKCDKCPKCAAKCCELHEKFELPDNISQTRCSEEIYDDDGNIAEDWNSIAPCYWYFNELSGLEWDDYTTNSMLVDLLEFFQE